jgi:hypothetical protein
MADPPGSPDGIAWYAKRRLRLGIHLENNPAPASEYAIQITGRMILGLFQFRNGIIIQG